MGTVSHKDVRVWPSLAARRIVSFKIRNIGIEAAFAADDEIRMHGQADSIVGIRLHVHPGSALGAGICPFRSARRLRSVRGHSSHNRSIRC